MIKYLNINGELTEISKAHISPADRSYRYGDGCFETMKLVNGKLILKDLHMNRLFTSLDQLHFVVPSYFTSSLIKESVLALAEANQSLNGRIRLTISRGNGNLYDLDDLQLKFIIEQYTDDKNFNHLNLDGLRVGIYRDAIKPADNISTIKSTSFLCYAMGAVWANKHKLHDAILLNQDSNLADSTIANVFIIKDGLIKTPSLNEGCVAGVMRKYLLTQFKQDDLPVEEVKISVDDLLNASEVFLTNAIRGIQWVKQVQNSHFTNDLTATLHQKYIAPLFNY